MPPKKDENKHYYGFDPAGLEKGAKVIKNLNLNLLGCLNP
jgi:hypothetical protein